MTRNVDTWEDVTAVDLLARATMAEVMTGEAFEDLTDDVVSADDDSAWAALADASPRAIAILGVL
jgi:hypothetical protein